MKQYKIGVDWYFSMAAALVLIARAALALGNGWFGWGLPDGGKWTLCLGLALLVIAYILLDRTCRQLVNESERLERDLDVRRNGLLREHHPLSQV